MIAPILRANTSRLGHVYLFRKNEKNGVDRLPTTSYATTKQCWKFHSCTVFDLKVYSKCNEMLNPGEEPANDEKIRLRGKRGSNETVRIRRDDDGRPAQPSDNATQPTTMTPADEEIPV